VVKDGKDVDTIRLDDVKDQIWKRGNDGSSDPAVNDGMCIRKRGDVFKPLFYGREKRLPEAWAAGFVPLKR